MNRLRFQDYVIFLVQIILRFLRGLSADAMVLLGDVISRAAGFDFEEALVAVSHGVGAAHRVVVGWADLLAASEQEALHATFHRHDVNVFSEKLNGVGQKKILNVLIDTTEVD